MSGIPELALPDLIQLAQLNEQSHAAWTAACALFTEDPARHAILEIEATMHGVDCARRRLLNHLLRNGVPTKTALRLAFGEE
jgi:hypothetical protein